jgi:hypothetical protein
MPPALDRSLRVLAAALILIQGVTHVLRWLDGYRDVEVIGPLFLVNAAIAVVVAGLLLVRGGFASALAGMVLSFSTLSAFAYSRQATLFGFSEARWDSIAFVAVVAEVVALLILLGWATLATRSGRRPGTAIERDLRRLGLVASPT